MHRSFAFPEPDDDDEIAEPITFDVAGEKFACLDDMPASAMYALGRRQDAPVVRSVDFVRYVLADDDEEGRFLALLHRRGSKVDDALLGEIVRYLTEAYTNRPTKRSGGSASGPRRTTTTSPDGSGSPASTAAPGAGSTSPTL